MYAYSKRSQTTVTKSRAAAATPHVAMGKARNLQSDHQALDLLLLSRALQAKLTVSHPADACEQEADRVADAVMGMPEPRPDTSGLSTVNAERKCPSCPETLEPEREAIDEEADHRLMREPDLSVSASPAFSTALAAADERPTDAASTLEVGPGVKNALSNLRGRGSPLPDATRAFMESRFGADFSEVRVHHDAGAGELARAVQAEAFTVRATASSGASA